METTARPRRWRDRLPSRLSVRMLMLLVLIVGGGLGWLANRARTQRKAVEAVQAIGGTVRYDFEVSFDRPPPPGPAPVKKPEPPAPAWLRKLVGDELFQEVTVVRFPKPLAGPLPVALEAFGRLEQLDYIDESRGGDNLALLGRLTTLRSVGPSGPGVTDATLERLSKLPRLEQVSLSRISATDAGLAQLARLPRLVWFSINKTPGITDVGLGPVLRGRKDLESLTLFDAGVTDATTEAFREMTGLKRLVIQGSTISDVGLANIGRATSLDLLIISSASPAITDAGFASLRDLTNLRTLELPGRGTTESGLDAFEKMKMLGRLTIYEGVTDAGAAHLAKLSSLTRLSLIKCPDLGDAGLAHLAGLTSLMRLDLLGSRVTDASLSNFNGMKALQHIDLRGTRVTPGGQAALRVALPLLSITAGPIPARPPAPQPKGSGATAR